MPSAVMVEPCGGCRSPHPSNSNGLRIASIYASQNDRRPNAFLCVVGSPRCLRLPCPTFAARRRLFSKYGSRTIYRRSAGRDRHRIWPYRVAGRRREHRRVGYDRNKTYRRLHENIRRLEITAGPGLRRLLPRLASQALLQVSNSSCMWLQKIFQVQKSRRCN